MKHNFKEIENGMTLYGPHRDDLKFLIENDDNKLNTII